MLTSFLAIVVCSSQDLCVETQLHEFLQSLVTMGVLLCYVGIKVDGAKASSQTSASGGSSFAAC